jgi:betaine-aldehyde dehydrogenase
MTTSHYIDGRWVEGQGSDCIVVQNRPTACRSPN